MKPSQRSATRDSRRFVLHGAVRKNIVNKVTRRLRTLAARIWLVLFPADEVHHESTYTYPLPAEVMLMIAKRINIATRKGIDDFIDLKMTCKYLENLLADETLISQSIKFYLPQDIKKSLRLQIKTLRDVQDLVSYRENVWWLLHKHLMPLMNPDPGREGPFLVDQKGCRSILVAGLWIRARVLGFRRILSSEFRRVVPLTDCAAMQTLTPAELIVLMYTAVIFQECHLWKLYIPNHFLGPLHRLREYHRHLRSAFLGWGPWGASELFEGATIYRQRHWWPYDASQVFTQFAEYEVGLFSTHFGHLEPDRYLRTTIENHMQQWTAQGSFRNRRIFTELGISDEGANTLQNFFDWCSSVTDPGQLPWN